MLACFTADTVSSVDGASGKAGSGLSGPASSGLLVVARSPVRPPSLRTSRAISCHLLASAKPVKDCDMGCQRPASRGCRVCVVQARGLGVQELQCQAWGGSADALEASALALLELDPDFITVSSSACKCVCCSSCSHSSQVAPSSILH